VSGGKKVTPDWLDQFSIEKITDQTMELLKLT
jgi:hypothetical protein